MKRLLIVLCLVLCSGCYYLKPNVDITLRADNTIRYKVMYGPDEYTTFDHISLPANFETNDITISVHKDK